MKDKATSELCLRARFVKFLYEYFKSNGGVTDHPAFFEEQLPFIVEAIISIQYYHNQILDQKGGVNTPSTINDNLITGNLLKDQFYRYLEQLEMDANNRITLIQHARSIFEYVDIGQYLEKHCNHYEAYKNKQYHHPFERTVNEFIQAEWIEEIVQIILELVDLDADNQAYLRIYLQRIYLTNAALFNLVAVLMADMMDVENSIKAKVVKFATWFGIAQQMMNDNCDVVPSSLLFKNTVAKLVTDAQADLKNKCFTLPLVIHLKFCPSGIISNYLNDYKANMQEEDFFDETIKSLSIFFSITISKKVSEGFLFTINT
ncbi:MAG: hypothetical protein HC892_20285, partial [Saprospiraceae bacterium]|nr:hypothetical protein [Saprospiraceae bacterium]